MWIVVSSKHCKQCNRNFEFDEMKLGKEPCRNGERIFFTCPLCGQEIDNTLENIQK